jgi:type IV pilus assembly protein PilE
MNRSLPFRNSVGFSLIELMIVVAVVAILSSVAYPSYQSHIRKSNRSAVQAFLMEVAARQQQRFLDVRSYAPSLTVLGMGASSDVQARYEITVATVAGPPPTFTLTAAPKLSQASDSCGTITVTSTGARTPADCW